MRIVYLIGGFMAVGLGGLGLVVPGLPGTVFFIIAAWCFSRSSPRFEQWVLNLPTVGPMVADHRAGLGMPKRAKIVAISSITVAVTTSVVLAIDNTAVRILLVVLGAIGIWYVGLRVPTKVEVEPPGRSPRSPAH